MEFSLCDCSDGGMQGTEQTYMVINYEGINSESPSGPFCMGYFHSTWKNNLNMK